MSNSFSLGVRMAGVGGALPKRIVTNQELEKIVNTSHEWIYQRTGIEERRYCDHINETTVTLSRDSLAGALKEAGMEAEELDLIIVGCCTQEMNVPSTAARVAAEFGLTTAGHFDILTACSGFVTSLNVADTLVRSGRYKKVGVVGCDVLTNIIDKGERSVSILFGDAAGAAVLVQDDNPERGCLHQVIQGDGTRWDMLYQPHKIEEVVEWDLDNQVRLSCLRMQGREVYKFAVKKFQEVIAESLHETGLSVDDISQFVCHQSNARIIESAIHKLGLPEEKVLININRIGNTSSGSVGYCLHELWEAGKIKEGDAVIMVAFGAGLTWASSVWRV